jgi:hypothetical protein
MTLFANSYTREGLLRDMFLTTTHVKSKRNSLIQ